MRFSYAESLTDPRFYIPLAKAAEAAGYHSMTIADSIAYPFESDSKYPYTPDGNREFLDGKEIVETFVLTARFGRGDDEPAVQLLRPQAAHPAAGADGQAGGFAGRADRQPGGTRRRHQPVARGLRADGRPIRPSAASGWTSASRSCKGLTTGDYFEFHGEFYDIPKTKMTPAPTQPIPILIGGHADAALRRAARLDGWMHGGGSDPEELDRLIARLNKFRDEEGKTGPFEIHVISTDAYTVDGIKRLEDKGVTDAIVGFRYPYIKGPDTEPLENKIRNLERFAEKVIRKSSGGRRREPGAAGAQV